MEEVLVTTSLQARTYFPDSVAELDPVRDVLAGVGEGFRLVGPQGQVSIPAELHAVLTQVVDAMQAGRAVTITPHRQRLTTQEAADLLGVSRPTVIKLINAEEIPCERISNRRAVMLDDVLAYQRRRQEQQLAAIAATAADLDDEFDEAELRSALAAARAARGQARGSRAR